MSRLKKLNNQRSTVVYERTKDEKEPKRRPALIYIFILILMCGLAYLLFFSGALEIKNTEIQGYSKPEIIGEIADNYRQSTFMGNNILFINIRGLEKRILDSSRVKTVNITRGLPNTLKINIEESTGAIVWNTVGENFIIDDRGYVIEENNNINLPAVVDNANIEIGLGERVASPTFIKYIIDMWSNFELVTGHRIESIIILDIFSDVHVKSKSGWTVYFDSTKDPISQLENLSKVLRAAEESGRKQIEYIDMRLQDKVFYK